APRAADDRHGGRHQQDHPEKDDRRLLRLEAGSQHDDRVDEHRKPRSTPRKRRALRLKSAIQLAYFSHSTAAMMPETMAPEIVRGGTARVVGNGRSCRIASSFAFQRTYATAQRTDDRTAKPMARPITTTLGSNLVANCSSSTPPASSASAVRIQARNVRS